MSSVSCGSAHVQDTDYSTRDVGAMACAVTAVARWPARDVLASADQKMVDAVGRIARALGDRARGCGSLWPDVARTTSADGRVMAWRLLENGIRVLRREKVLALGHVVHGMGGEASRGRPLWLGMAEYGRTIAVGTSVEAASGAVVNREEGAVVQV
jgi:hypothetical protein